VKSQDKTLAVFGPENGDTLPYGHGDLLYGENAPKEVYPIILRWLEARATKVEGEDEKPQEQPGARQPTEQSNPR